MIPQYMDSRTWNKMNLGMISLINIYWPYDSRARETSEVVIKFTLTGPEGRIDGPALPPPLAAAAATSAPSPAGYCCYRRRRPRHGPALGWTTRLFFLKCILISMKCFKNGKLWGKAWKTMDCILTNGKPSIISKIDVIFCVFLNVLFDPVMLVS